MMFCQRDSHAGTPLDQQAHYVRRFLSKAQDFFDETSLSDFTGHKQENILKISGHDLARGFLGNLPFCKARGSPAGGFNNV